ncbi:unnamed protein product [Peniophora sp. CBMAI 1063]|nr:unnamed protein product [Peniophora sp. CBMAI 1063]
MSSSGWHSRASPHPAGPSYEPSRSDLLLVLKRSTRVEPDGFSLALLAPDVAVDALGRVLTVPSDDFAALQALASNVADTNKVPDTGSFGNQWRIKQRRTDWPIDSFRVARGPDEAPREVGVYGFDGEQRELNAPVGDITELPNDLHELLKLTLEAREGLEGGERDDTVIRKVLALLD